MSSNSVICLFQSADKIVWAGTNDGLCYHNGINFSTLNINQKLQSETYIYSIGESAEEKILWIGTNEGLFKMDKKTSGVEKVIFAENGQSDVPVWRIVSDNNENLWIGTLGDGLYKYNIRTRASSHYTTVSANKYINEIILSEDGEIWFSTLSDKCLFRYNSGTDSFSKVEIVDKFTKKEIEGIYCFCQASYGEIWLCSRNCNLFRLDTSNLECVSIEQNLQIASPRSIIEDKPGHLIIGTDKGLLGFDCNTISFDIIDNGESRNKSGLNDRFVHSLLKDHEGGLWVGTYFGGVNYKSPQSNKIREITPPDQCGHIISVMSEIDNSEVLIGSDDGGLSLYNNITGEYHKVIIDENHPNLNIHCIYPDGQKYWIGTYGRGIYLIDKDFSTIKHFQHNNVTYGDLNVYCAIRDSQGDFWIGTSSGICRYNPQSEMFERMLTLSSGSEVTDVVEWEGSLYFASQGNGLIKYNMAEEAFTFVGEEINRAKRVICLEIYGDKLYLGTYNGVFIYDGENLTEYINPQLSDKNINGIVADNRLLWLIGTSGLYVILNDGSVNRFNIENGLLSENFNTNSIVRLSNGDILAGSQNGIIAFKGSELSRWPDNCKISPLINNVYIINENGSKKPVSSLNPVIITSLNGAIALDFSALNYQSPYGNYFRYRLLGREKRWTYINRDKDFKEIVYSDIRPGRYRFEVSAAQSPYHDFGEVAHIDIEVKRPLWNWIQIIAGLAAIGICFWFIYVKTKQSRRNRNLKNTRMSAIAEKVVFQSILEDILKQSQSTLQNISMTIGPNSDKFSQKISKSDADIIINNIINLRNHVEKNANEYLRLSEGEENGKIIRKSDMTWVIVKICKSYINIAKESYGIEYQLTVSPNAVIFGNKLEVISISKVVMDMIDNSLEYAKSYMLVAIEVEGDDIIISVKRDGDAWKCNKITSSYKIETFSRVEKHNHLLKMTIFTAPDILEENTVGYNVSETDDDKSINDNTIYQYRTDRHNIVIIDKDARIEGTETLFNDVKFNVLSCQKCQDADKIAQNCPVCAILFTAEEAKADDIKYLGYLKSQYPWIIFISVCSTVNNLEKIGHLDMYADICLSQPVSFDLMLKQIYNLMKLSRRDLSSGNIKSVSESRAGGDKFTRRVKEIITEHIGDQNLSTALIAEEMNVSRATVFNRIRASLNTTPNLLIRDMRLEAAAKLLSTSNVRISEVYDKVGFSSGSYFSKLFYEKYGMSPKEFNK